MRIDMLDPPFPVYLLAAPINQIMFFAVALSFVRYKGVGLKELGLRKANVKVLTVASLAALPLPVYILQEVIFGPDPLAQLVAEAATPRNSLQLVALVAISLALVGPCEELAFRGFIQKGFENALSKRKGAVDRLRAFCALPRSQHTISSSTSVCRSPVSRVCMASNRWKHHSLSLDAWSLRFNHLCSSI
jgi:hypothetical protein